MKIGARIIKTGLAVVLAIYISMWLGFLNSASFAAATAALSVQPSLSRSFSELYQQLRANLIGVGLALLGIYIFGDSPFVIGLIVVLIISINLAFGSIADIGLLIYASIAITVGIHNHYFINIIHRFELILIGYGASLFINAFFIPPNHEKRLLEHIHQTHIQGSLLLKNTMKGDIQSPRIEKKKFSQNINTLKDIFTSHQDEKKWIFKKRQDLRKKVIFRKIISAFDQELLVIESIDKHLPFVMKHNHSELSSSLSLMQNDLNFLSTYFDKILAKFEGKILPIKEPEKLPILSEIQPNFNTVHLLFILFSINELSHSLEHLDLLVSQYKKE